MNEMEQMNATQQFSGNVTIRFYSWDFGQEIFCRGLFSRANKEAGYKGASGAVLGQTSGGCQGGNVVIIEHSSPLNILTG